MTRKQIKTVCLERQPHRDGIKRLQFAYQLLIESAKQASVKEEIDKKSGSQLPEVKKCQS